MSLNRLVRRLVCTETTSPMSAIATTGKAMMDATSGVAAGGLPGDPSPAGSPLSSRLAATKNGPDQTCRALDGVAITLVGERGEHAVGGGALEDVHRRGGNEQAVRWYDDVDLLSAREGIPAMWVPTGTAEPGTEAPSVGAAAPAVPAVTRHAVTANSDTASR